MYTRGLLKLLEKLAKKLAFKTLAFESDYLLHAFFLRLDALAAKKHWLLKAENGLIE